MLGRELTDRATDYILNAFSGIIDKTRRSNGLDLPDLATRISRNFQIERPKKSGEFEIDAEKIVHYLWEDVQKLSKVLDIYLKLFVDMPLSHLVSSGKLHTARQIIASGKHISFFRNSQINISRIFLR